MNSNTMRAKDTVSSKLAECFVTIKGNRYNFMQAIDFEAKFKKTKTEVPILGKTGGGNKSTGWQGTGSATFHYNTSIFRQLMVDIKTLGKTLILKFKSPMKILLAMLAGRQLFSLTATLMVVFLLNLMLLVNILMRTWISLLKIS